MAIAPMENQMGPALLVRLDQDALVPLRKLLILRQDSWKQKYLMGVCLQMKKA